MGDRSGFAWKDAPEYNWIDTLVYDKLKQVKMQPSDLCTDGEFIRRRLSRPDRPAAASRKRSAPSSPTPAPSRVKRDELVDKLVGSPDYVEHWTNKWADLLQVNRKFLGDEGSGGVSQLDPRRRRRQHALRQVRLRAS